MERIVQVVRTAHASGIAMLAGIVIMALVAVVAIVTSFWGWMGVILFITGWLLYKKEEFLNLNRHKKQRGPHFFL